jgi:hypothetical protein
MLDGNYAALMQRMSGDMSYGGVFGADIGKQVSSQVIQKPKP